MGNNTVDGMKILMKHRGDPGIIILVQGDVRYPQPRVPGCAYIQVNNQLPVTENGFELIVPVAAGCNGHLTKPIKKQDFLSALQN